MVQNHLAVRRVHGRSRAVTLAASLLLATLSLSIPPTAMAQSTVGTCASGTQRTSYGFFVRARSDVSGAIGRATIVNLKPCTNGGSTGFGVNYDVPWVLPANIQGGGSDIVQIGYGRCGSSVDCSSMPNDDKQHFVYTYNDDSGGVMVQATWYPNEPVGGRVYGFKIVRDTNSSGNPIWTYCIRDITMGQSYQCKNRPRTWSSGDLVWFGAETNNTHSQLGHKPDSVNDINIRGQYRRNGDWYIVDKWGGGDPCVLHANSGSPPARYKCTTKSLFDSNGDGSNNDKETADPWTDDTL